MKEIAATKPGHYFVFNAEDRTILATVDTTFSRVFEPSAKRGAA
jgi:hypothetical protein